MFRKGSSEIKNWAEYGIEPYVKIQREIILDAVKMLKPGGIPFIFYLHLLSGGGRAADRVSAGTGARTVPGGYAGL